MKVLAIDPGYDRMGVAIMEKELGKEKLLYSSCITTDKSTELSERLFVLGIEVEKLLKKHTPDALAIETLFFNKNQKTAMGVAQARGMIMYLARKMNCFVYEFGPQEIKVAVTGYGKSDKTAVIAMLKRLILKVPEKALDDEYDAIALAVTALAHHKIVK